MIVFPDMSNAIIFIQGNLHVFFLYETARVKIDVLQLQAEVSGHYLLAMVGIDAVFEGNSPAWTLGTGMSRVNKGPTSELAQTGFSGFYDQPDAGGSTTRRHFDDRYYETCQSMAEPSIIAAPQSNYYQRRKADPDSYRPHVKQFSQPHYPERPDRRKYIPDPSTGQSNEVAQGIRTIKVRQNSCTAYAEVIGSPLSIHGLLVAPSSVEREQPNAQNVLPHSGLK